jgi:hypothetical protein
MKSSVSRLLTQVLFALPLAALILKNPSQALDQASAPRVIVGGELERAPSTTAQFSAACPGGVFTVSFVNDFVRDRSTGVPTVTGRVSSMSFNGNLSTDAIAQVNASVGGSEIESADVSCSFTRKDSAYVLLRLNRSGRETAVSVLITNGQIRRLR